MDSNIDTNSEMWQVEAGGRIFDTNFDEMTTWIADGSLLRIDRVRKGNLRWIEAGKVPSLVEFFNAKEAGEPIMPVITTTHVETLGVPEQGVGGGTPLEAGTHNAAANPTFGPAGSPPPTPVIEGACAMHPDIEAVWACDTCSNSFCRACPTGYGANVKICPFCGAMCRSLAQAAVEARTYQVNVRAHSGEGFGFSDFGKALAHPFKFKVSLIVGAIMFAAFSLGSGAGGFGGILAMFGGIVCVMCSNMLTFGVLANTVENFSQGKLDDNFMPSFDDFSIWDDVVHPFFLSVGVYISSFGPLIAVALVAIFMVVGAVKNEMNGFQDDAARAVNPELPYAANAAKQSSAVREILDKTKNMQQKRVESMERKKESYEAQMDAVDRGEEYREEVNPVSQAAADEEKEIAELNQMIQDSRKAQLESVIGKAPETKAEEQKAFIKEVLGYGILVVLVGGICLLWGLFYFPAASAVAGYTRSFAATLNPTVGLDTIKHLGGSYALILVFGLLLLIVSSIISGVLNMVFFAFDLPGLGNLPAKFLGSMFGFYLSVVFSCILGYALFKKADKLALPS